MTDSTPATDDGWESMRISDTTSPALALGAVLAVVGFFAAAGTCAYGIVTVNKAVGWTGALGMLVMAFLAIVLIAFDLDARTGKL